MNTSKKDEVMDIDKIEAGPELDALVAEKVMGWVGRENELWTDGATGKLTKWGTDNCITLNDATTSFYFRPSTDIAAAWEVVEKIKATSSRGYVLDFLRGEWTAGLRACGDSGEPELYGFDAGSAKEAPLAICRAALKSRQW